MPAPPGGETSEPSRGRDAHRSVVSTRACQERKTDITKWLTHSGADRARIDESYQRPTVIAGIYPGAARPRPRSARSVIATACLGVLGWRHDLYGTSLEVSAGVAGARFGRCSSLGLSTSRSTRGSSRCRPSSGSRHRGRCASSCGARTRSEERVGFFAVDLSDPHQSGPNVSDAM